MAYLALARKYRPQTFDEVIGQEPIIKALRNSLAAGHIHHAYLFAGMRGVGKTTSARLLAKALNCFKGPTPDPCNECLSCVEVRDGASVDILEIDGASSGGVEQIRELRQIVRYTPFRDRYKVVIIDEVHMVTGAGFNALLKTLEEPPPYIVFIFATTDYRKIPATILSRCQQYYFRPLTLPTLVTHLRLICEKEQVTVPERLLIRVGQLGAGSSRDSISLLDQLLAYSGDTVREEDAVILNILPHDVHARMAAAIAEGDSTRVLEEIARLVETGYDLTHFLWDFQSYLRQLLVVRAAREPQKILDVYAEEIAELREVGGRFGSEEEILRLLQFALQLEANLKFVQNPRHLIEVGFLKMSRFGKLIPIAEAYRLVEQAMK